MSLSSVKHTLMVLVIALNGVSCSTQDNLSPSLSNRTSNPIYLLKKEQQSDTHSLEKNPPLLNYRDKDCIDCQTTAEVSPSVQSDMVENDVIKTEPSRKIAPESSLRSGNTITQNSNHPDSDLDLVQLPNEENYQAVNSIWTSDLPQDSIVNQSAEYRNVIFNQLSSPSSLHTINSMRHDDQSKRGALEQNFKFKNIEMIQRSSMGSIHSVNYMGD